MVGSSPPASAAKRRSFAALNLPDEGVNTVDGAVNTSRSLVHGRMVAAGVAPDQDQSGTAAGITTALVSGPLLRGAAVLLRPDGTLTCRCHGCSHAASRQNFLVIVVLGFGGFALPACSISGSDITTAAVVAVERQAEYALPNVAVAFPTRRPRPPGLIRQLGRATTTRFQPFRRRPGRLPMPALAPSGVMISGAARFNPLEGDGSMVATASNFTVKNAAGDDVAFLDSCNGHPIPMGEYHYHALPKCVTSQVDTVGGPSHVIGVAFDGYLIYGDRDVDGAVITKDHSTHGTASRVRHPSSPTAPITTFFWKQLIARHRSVASRARSMHRSSRCWVWAQCLPHSSARCPNTGVLL